VKDRAFYHQVMQKILNRIITNNPASLSRDTFKKYTTNTVRFRARLGRVFINQKLLFCRRKKMTWARSHPVIA